MEAHFDAYAQDYDAALQAGLKASGEVKTYFAAGRIKIAGNAIEELVPDCGRAKAIDFGCGTGASSQLLQETFGFARVVGLDVSAESLNVAELRHRSSALQFETIEGFPARADADLVYCNGVFHHIAPDRRSESLAYIHASLKPGGAFVFWENNPWNPGVHYIMRAIPFDSDAQLIFPRAALQMLRTSGFKILQLRFFFIFPRPMAALRGLEPSLSRLPLGAQYQVLAVKE